MSILDGPSCAMPAALVTEGYEEKGNMYYRLYHGADRANQFEANARCQSVGARLAMMKTQEDLEIASDYRGGIIGVNFACYWSFIN